MNAKTMRLLKEARPLFWPWFVVTLAAFLPLVTPNEFTESISRIAFWGGVPLLATLSFGDEFQHRTLSLLLAQPAGRMEIWREKLSVTFVAVLSVVLIFFLAGRAASLGLERPDLVFAGVWIITITASGTFWTLFTRSTVGGVALNAGIHSLMVTISWQYVAALLHGKGSPSPAISTVVPIFIFVFLCYSVAMLWLGRRMLARFQATGGLGGDDLLMAGPNVMPEALAGWFRCRPTGAILNLIRKELRLLRPLWLITMLAAVAWTCLTALGFVPKLDSPVIHPNEAAAVLAIIVFSALTLAVLAGSLSLGEERTSGTHSWHLTLPAPVGIQWLVKLLMALFAGLVCAVLLPGLSLIAGGFLFGSPFMFVDPHFASNWTLIVLLLTLDSFWCSCAVKGTVRAVLWVFLVPGALVLAGQFGSSIAFDLADLIFPRLDIFTNLVFTNAVAHLPLVSLNVFYLPTVLLVLVPIVLFAIFQSYRLFRAQVQDSISSVIRKLLPLATVAFLCGFSLVTFDSFVSHAQRQMLNVFREIEEAIVKIQPGPLNLDEAHPLELTMEDLAKAAPLSERTRHWLRNSHIRVGPNPGYFPCCNPLAHLVPFISQDNYRGFIATIHRAGGSECTVVFGVGGNHKVGYLGGFCK
jgi:hypothetical protein